MTSGDDLDTAVFISLFTDQQARADDTYDGDDRRGWWGDLGEDYCIGSRLWLIYRQRLSRDTAGAVINRKDGIKYTLNNSVTIGLDGTALTPVTAVLVSPLDDPAAGGALGNAPVGTVLTLDNSYSGVDSQVTLMNPATGGANVETDGPLRTRMLLAYQALPQGGSETDYVNWALAVSGVTRAWCVRRLMGVGTVGIYIMCDGDDQTNHGFPAGTDGLSHYEDWGSYAKATGDQLRVADAIYPNQTITALVYVASPIPKVIDFAITGIIEQEQDLTAAISTAINLVFFTRGDPAGEGIVTLSSINAAIASAPGTDGFLMTSPTQNITLGVGELPQLGTVTIT
ncbi:phage baseplate protein [Candidatus Hamiltonella defensa]|uniref:Phage baseplate protein n=1 Tax=Candidatus Williamhamiltonella defendens TaxID=138072 RepID=A0AAC9YGP4_9ENTR|nr:phage baseplate protein [Candidatus Hamiltonella defensa]MBK4362119.1 phage baseplate protein [Candidatus Hamiltonella defensa]